MAYLDENGLAYFKGKLDQITDKLNDQITETDTALDNLTSLIERDTASGSIVEVNTEYAAPVEKLVVNIEPQQDLHGYESPWPAGSGKNKLPLNFADIKSAATYGSWSGNKYTFRGITWTIDIDNAGNVVGITVNGTAEQETSLPIALPFDIDGSYSLSGCPTGGNGTSTYNIRIYNASTSEVVSSDYGNGSTFTATNSVKARITVYAGYTASNLKFYPMICLATETDSTFAPYSNICPISGFTGANVTRTGKNLLNSNTLSQGDYNGTNINVRVSQRVEDRVRVMAGVTYTYSLWNPNYTHYWLYISDEQNNLIQTITVWGATSAFTTITFTATVDGLLTPIFGKNENHTWVPLTVADVQASPIQLELGSTATSYEPYVGSQISITFPNSAGTVYGGTLTINPDRTGTLVVDKAMVDLETLTWSNADTYYASGQALAGVKAPDSGGTKANAIAEKYVIASSNGVSGGTETGIGIRPNGMLYATNFGSTPTGMIIYELATTIAYTLTSAEVSGILSTLRGTNYIWANTGDITELKYQSGGFATTEVAAQMIEKSAGTKADVITETASGSIVSFSDGADGLPVKSLTVNLEPQQDLHGYDAPWPEGGNVNKCPSISSSMTFAGVTLSPSKDGKCKLVGTATSSGGRTTLGSPAFELPAGTYYLSSNIGYDSTQSNPVQLIATKRSDNSIIVDRQQSVFTLAETTEIYIGINVKSGGAYNIEFYIQLESGSAPTAYSPYSNICPIAGFTGAEIADTGINIWDEEWEEGYYGSSGTPSESSGYIRSKNYISVKPNEQYYCKTGKASNFCLQFYGVDKTFHSQDFNYRDAIITIPSDCYYLRFWRNESTYANNTSINYPATDTAYHAYTGSKVSVTFPSSAGTVYGGTLTINPDRTGTLVVDRAMVDLGTLEWNIVTNARGDFFSNYSLPKIAEGRDICSQYDRKNPYGSDYDYIYYAFDDGTRGAILIRDSRYTTPTEFKTAMSGVQLVYGLATPVTYALTATEISGILTTLYGTNNIWADTGDVTVEYPVDTKLYIQQLTKPTEDDMTADNAIAAGTFFMIGNTLYLATAQIAAGATITPGTNATKLSLADALNQLNA